MSLARRALMVFVCLPKFSLKVCERQRDAILIYSRGEKVEGIGGSKFRPCEEI